MVWKQQGTTHRQAWKQQSTVKRWLEKLLCQEQKTDQPKTSWAKTNKKRTKYHRFGLFWTKYAFPRQIKPRILKLTTSKGHSNLLAVFSFVNFEEKGYYRVVSVGQLSFDCRSYCGRSSRMQGEFGHPRVANKLKMAANKSLRNRGITAYQQGGQVDKLWHDTMKGSTLHTAAAPAVRAAVKT